MGTRCRSAQRKRSSEYGNELPENRVAVAFIPYRYDLFLFTFADERDKDKIIRVVEFIREVLRKYGYAFLRGDHHQYAFRIR